MTVKTINGTQLRIHLAAAGVPAAVLAEASDASYRPCTAEWLAGDYHRWFLESLAAFGVREYSAEDFDCDDFVDAFATFARIAHRRTQREQGLSPAALPIGRLNFLRLPHLPPSAAQKHALAWAFTSDRGLIFIEPQVLFRVETLTRDQLASATRCSD